MKKYLLFVLMAAAVIFASCKSTDQETADQAKNDAETKIEQQANDDTQGLSVDQLISKAEESRAKAVEAGAENYYANQLKVTDEMLLAAKEKAANGDKKVSEEVKDINNRYLALQKASETKNLKKRIEELGFDQENKEAYDAAGKLYDDLEEKIQNGADGITMLKAAEVSYGAYYAIFYDSFKKLATKERNAALEQKKNADSVKAGVARKEEYKTYANLIQTGDNHFVTKNPEKAYDSYKEAKEKFETLYKDVSERRAEAQRKIEEAKAKVRDAEAYAGEADETAPLGDEKIDGIEENDAVLLEEETFADPDDAVIEVKEDVKVENDGAVQIFKEAVGVEE
ncbi:MAG: hypothetical protein IK002_08190 [Treponema sp.]|uniref:hypothetical protein n=1 Tax=Treponema sp. TaxID=166 RepID=UPI00298E7E69|nr:hypothetical protein [Treponema sp.]MBR5933947.1 hypothetical protein [Treponema sp.]